MPMKIIFLDIDGVLNSRNTTRMTSWGSTFVEDALIRNLKHVIDETGAEVVLSSNWRYDRDDPSLNMEFLELRDELARYGICFYGFTPELHDRGKDIDQWVKEHPKTTNFVILDDKKDIALNRNHWVQTTMAHGLGPDEAEKAIQVLLDDQLTVELPPPKLVPKETEQRKDLPLRDRLGSLLHRLQLRL